jgi:hypothetical protein
MPSDDDTITAANGSRRAQRIRRRRRWRRRLLLGVAVALLLTGTAYAVTGPLRPGDDDAGSRTSATPPSAAGSVPASEQACRAPLSPLDPLRLWIGGDSLAGSLGPSLGELAGKSGVVQPVMDSRVSSGLLSADFFDWPKKGAEDMFTYNPEVTVFIIGANDAKNLSKGAEQDPRWRQQYSVVVEQMLKVLVGNGRSVYWIGAPIMSDAAFSERVKGVNSVFQEVAAKHPGVTYVDAYAVFSGPDGKFAPTLPTGDGKVVRVRAQDGIHFTPEGGDVLAGTVFDQLEPQCRIMQQAVEGVIKPVVEVKGSDSVPGTRRSGTSGSAGSGPATTRAQPAPTAPATTSVPPPP